MTTIFCRGIKVCIGVNIIGSVCGGGSYCLLVERASCERFLNATGAIGFRGDSGDADACRLTAPVIAACETDGDADDGKARSWLRDFHVSLSGASLWLCDANLAQNFVLLKRGREHVNEEVTGLDCALALRADD